MIKQLLINGCSYNEVYCNNQGPHELAKSLGLNRAESLSMGGSANGRILRTTIKHSYQNPVPTLYLVGLTFLNRWELPVIDADKNREFEGRWINPQSQKKSHEKWQFNWNEKDTEVFKDLQFKAAASAAADYLEDLMYRCLGLIADLKQRGHRIVIWNNCDLAIPDIVKNDTRFDLLNRQEFVDRLQWVAVPWQHKQGARASQYEPGTVLPPVHLQHILPEDFQYLNSYLTNYIKQNKILE